MCKYEIVGYYVNVMFNVHGGGVESVKWGSWALLMRLAVDKKKLFLQCDVLVLTDLNLLPEGRVSKSFLFGVRGVSYDLSCSPQGPGGVQVLVVLQVATIDLFGTLKDTIQSVLILVQLQQSTRF